MKQFLPENTIISPLQENVTIQEIVDWKDNIMLLGNNAEQSLISFVQKHNPTSKKTKIGSWEGNYRRLEELRSKKNLRDIIPKRTSDVIDECTIRNKITTSYAFNLSFMNVSNLI